MRLILGTVALFLVSVAIAGNSAWAFNITKIADCNTPIPSSVISGCGFWDPAISDGVVAFMAGSGNNLAVVKYAGGVISVVADANTPVPGGTETFGATLGPVFIPMGSGSVAFHRTPYRTIGIYSDAGGVLHSVVDGNTPIPGFPFDFWYFPSFGVGGTEVAFFGVSPGSGSGLYRTVGGIPHLVVGDTDVVPGGTGTFRNFESVSLNGDNVAFLGSGSNWERGVYTDLGGTLHAVADLNTPVPGGAGNFTGFQSVVLRDGQIAFVHASPDGSQHGVYLATGSSLQVVADTNTPVPGGGGTFDGFFAVSIDHGNVVFTGWRSGGHYGVYTTLDGGLRKIVDETDDVVRNLGAYGVVESQSYALSGNQVAFVAYGYSNGGIFVATMTDFCGNRVVDPGEQCDDGNSNNNDGCKNDCTLNVCGDGVVNTAVEQCDDGNLVNGDGCSATCQIETGWSCAGQPSACTAPNGQACSSNAQCTSEFCVDGVCCDTACGGGVSNDCQACSVAAGGTADGTCTQSTGNTCDDSSACTQTDTCQAGTCTGSNPVVCTASDQCHDIGTCNPSIGTCSNPNKPDGSACNDGDGCPADTCQGGVCQPVACPSHDTVVLPVAPLAVTIRAGKTEVTKTVRVTVRNADAKEKPGHVISLGVDDSDCPGSVAGEPNFSPKTKPPASSVLVVGGGTKTATVLLTIPAADFTGYPKAPRRCTLVFTATAVVPGGSNDPQTSNNVVPVELNVIDKNDGVLTAKHETTLASLRPVAVTISAGSPSATKNVKPVVGNADAKEPQGDSISATAADGTCLAGTVGVVNPASATVKGGATKTTTLPVQVQSSGISTPNKLSPYRCVATVSATGPGGDTVGTNNTTQLVIDVLNKNDY